MSEHKTTVEDQRFNYIAGNRRVHTEKVAQQLSYSFPRPDANNVAEVIASYVAAALEVRARAMLIEAAEGGFMKPKSDVLIDCA